MRSDNRLELTKSAPAGDRGLRSSTGKGVALRVLFLDAEARRQ